jgi:type 1 glutamine amidotransferase
MKRAFIVQGGWDGHEPGPVSRRFEKLLKEKGFTVEVYDTLDAFLDVDRLKTLHLIVPVWTMGTITREQLRPILEAVASGVGLAGCHGGMCDAFRNETDWQFMTGGQWVAHPGNDGTPYTVNIKKNCPSPIVDGMDDFEVSSEQYYVHVDPAVCVLATTRFPTAKGYHATNGAVDVPVTWTKMWGYGRVFYTSLGHHDDVFDIFQAQEMMVRGMLWAAEGKDIAAARGLDHTKLL